MELRNTYRLNKGLTLIEILIVIGILVAIISIGMIVDFSSFASNSFEGEEAKIVSILERARSQSMANVCVPVSGFVCNDGQQHGVCYDGSNYVIFQGTSYSASTEKELIKESLIVSPVSTKFACSDGGIAFSQLTGKTNTDTIHITYGTKSADIIINNEGRINW